MDSEELVAAGLAAFDRVVASTPGFRPRAGQREMATQIARAFAEATLGPVDEGVPDRRIAVVQAGTGVGKSAAYIAIGAEIARLRKTRLLIASSTVALQEQLVHKDLPLIAKAFDRPFTFALAKGRGRYVCKTRLMRRAQIVDARSLALEPEVGPQHSIAEPMKFYRNLAEALASGSWSGDRDDLGEQPAAGEWDAIAAERHTCTARACPEYSRCTYFAARKNLVGVDVIVANHDLVLASLGTRLLPELSDCLVVFDEAHSLPQTAIEQFSANVDLARVKWLDKLPQTLASVAAELQQPLAADVATLALELQTAMRDTSRLIWDQLASHISRDGVLRFAHGRLPGVLRDPVKLLGAHADLLAAQTHELAVGLRDRMKEHPQENARWTSLFASLGAYVPRLQKIQSTCELLLTEGEDAAHFAKWISVDEKSSAMVISLHACPLVPGDLLAREVWPHVRGAVLTSATLTACGSFDFALRELGLNGDPAVSTRQVNSPFDYARQGELVVISTRSDPKQLQAYSEEVSDLIARDMERVELGALALFTSRKHLEDTYSALPEHLKPLVLRQGSLSRPSLLATHRERVAAGEPSIIFGTQAFGEGIDLPGELLETLYIAKLPFQPPTDPVGEARAEFIERRGGSAFDELVVPQVSVRLSQWTGRPIRTETDSARIVCFDNRLVRRDYGKRILQGIPPFTVRQERPTVA